MNESHDYDFNKDGTLGKDEVEIVKRRVSTHRKLAIASMATLVFSGIWIITMSNVETIKALGSVLDLYWITLGGVIATYMGSEVWASK